MSEEFIESKQISVKQPKRKPDSIKQECRHQNPPVAHLTAIKPPAKSPQPSLSWTETANVLIADCIDPSKCNQSLFASIQIFLTPLHTWTFSDALRPKPSIKKSKSKESFHQLESALENLSLDDGSSVISIELKSLKSFALQILNQTYKTIQSLPKENADFKNSNEEIKDRSSQTLKSAKSSVSRKTSSATLSSKPSVSSLRSTKTRTPSEISISLTVGKEDHGTFLTQIALACFDAIQSFEKHLSKSTYTSNDVPSASHSNYESEKALSNVATRLVEAGQIENAGKVLQILHQKICATSETFPVVSIPEITRRPSTLKPRASKLNLGTTVNIGTIKSDQQSSATSATQNLHKLLQIELNLENDEHLSSALPWMKSRNNPPPLSLIAATIFNSLRCVLIPGRVKDGKIFKDIASNPFGLLHWCMQLKQSDFGAGAKMFDSVFRYLHKIGGMLTDPVLAFLCKHLSLKFFFHASSFSCEIFLDLALRNFSSSEKVSDLLLEYYQWILNTLDEMRLNSLNMSHRYLLLLDQLFTTSRKMGFVEVNAHSCRIIQQTMITEISTTSPFTVIMANFVKTSMWIELFFSETHETDALDSNTTNSADLILDYLKCSSELLRKYPICELNLILPSLANGANTRSSNNEIEFFKDVTRIYSRMLDICRKAVAKNNFGVNTQLLDKERVVSSVVDMFSFWMNAISISDSDSDFSSRCEIVRKIAPSAVYLKLAFAKIDFEQSGSDDRNILQIIQQIKIICEKLSYGDGFNWIATACYNFGSAMYKENAFEKAVQWFQLSCANLEICKIFVLGSGKSDADICKTLMKRYESLGICLNSMNNSEATLAFLDESCIGPNGKIQDQSAIKMLDKIMKVIGSKNFNGNIPNLAVLSGIADSRMKFTLLEYELDYLLGGFDGTKDFHAHSRMQSVLKNILKLDRVEELPIMKARCLVHRANLLRFSGSGHIPLAISDCLKAIYILSSQKEKFNDVSLYDELAIANTTLGICYNETDQYQ
ncbi:hypothetical protein HK100_012060, partial [Physocladia obscura]